MRKAIVLLGACVLISGCASYPSIPSGEELARAVNIRFSGRPVTDLAERYGIAHAQDVFQGQRYLLWHNARKINFTREQVSTTNGTVGSASDWWGQVPYAQTTSTRVADPQSYQCTMQVAVTEAGVVKAIGFLGKMGACQDFMP